MNSTQIFPVPSHDAVEPFQPHVFAVLAQKGRRAPLSPLSIFTRLTPEISSQILEAFSDRRSRCMNSAFLFPTAPARWSRSLKPKLNSTRAAGSTTAKSRELSKRSARHKTPGYSSGPYILCKPRDSARRRKLLCGRQVPALMLCLSLTFRFQCAKRT